VGGLFIVGAMPLVRCPICDRLFQPEQSPAVPFCCQRCRLIDLGRWLDEGYGLPKEPEQQTDNGGQEQ
jgi:endogenous inhibitor of DNA gyrase (YacG/DUF329 family)